MNQNFNSFFENPTMFGLIAIIVIVASPIVIAYLNNRNSKKTRADNKERGTDIVASLEATNATIRILIDKEQNTVNKQSAEEIIESTLRHAENSVKNEIMRIFHHNNRDEPRRQVLIKKAINSVTERVYDSCITALKTLSYKETNLSEFLIGLDIEELKRDLLEHIFTKSLDVEQDLSDTLFFTETYFTAIITNAKSYYSNL